MPVSPRMAIASAVTFFLLLLGLPLLRSVVMSHHIALFDAFYRSGALVFGGGHVVLPLLREAFVAPGWVTDDAFLARSRIRGPLRVK